MQHDPIPYDIVNRDMLTKAAVIAEHATAEANASGHPRHSSDWWRAVAIGCCRPVENNNAIK